MAGPVIVAAIGAIAVWWLLRVSRPGGSDGIVSVEGGRMRLQAARDAADARARFVWVDDDGSARELTADECRYLATPFEGADGGRPYIKSRYKARTPDGRLGGYLERRMLPRGVVVRSGDG